jgi:very-short-patch-repair endonuclease
LDGFKNKCKQCEKENREKKLGRTTRKNINNIEDANSWLQENFPKYCILKWGGAGQETSLILDKDRGIQFEYSFMRFKDKVQQHPERLFGASTGEVAQKSRETFKSKYGVQSALQIPEVKRKQEETMIERYGVENAMQNKELQQRQIDTIKKIYGVNNSFQAGIVREKSRKTMLEKYGSEYATQNEELQKKRQETNIEKWGVPHPAQNEELSQKGIQTKIDNGSLKLYNGKLLKEIWQERSDIISYVYFCELVRKYGLDLAIKYEPKGSEIEEIMKLWLEKNNISFIHNRKFLGSDKFEYRPDFQLTKYDIIIECDGLSHHSGKLDSLYGKKLYNKEYQKKKRSYYLENGWRPLFFWSDEIKNNFFVVTSIISNRLKKDLTISGRKCEKRLIDFQDAKPFLDENHLMGSGKGRCYSLLFDNQVVAILQAQWEDASNKFLEISRFSTKNNISIQGGFTKLLKFAIESEKPNQVITRIDQRYGSGEYLANFGFKKINDDPSFVWTDGSIHFPRWQFPRNSGFDQGLFQAWDCGQAKWVLDLR